MTDLTEVQQQAADWLQTHWLAVVGGGPITKQLRERFGLVFAEAVTVIAEVRRRQGK